MTVVWVGGHVDGEMKIVVVMIMTMIPIPFKTRSLKFICSYGTFDVTDHVELFVACKKCTMSNRLVPPQQQAPVKIAKETRSLSPSSSSRSETPSRKPQPKPSDADDCIDWPEVHPPFFVMRKSLPVEEKSPYVVDAYKELNQMGLLGTDKDKKDAEDDEDDDENDEDPSSCLPLLVSSESCTSTPISVSTT